MNSLRSYWHIVKHFLNKVHILYSGVCENANGFCDHLCLALPVSSQGTHVCKCAIGFILDVNQRGCVAGKVSTLASSIFITGRNEVVAKVIFLHLFVILFTGGVCLSACWDTTPQDQTPPDQADTPSDQADTPPDQADTPPDQADTPLDQADPPWEAHTSIRSTSGRYASYWNAFLFI